MLCKPAPCLQRGPCPARCSSRLLSAPVAPFSSSTNSTLHPGHSPPPSAAPPCTSPAAAARAPGRRGPRHTAGMGPAGCCRAVWRSLPACAFSAVTCVRLAKRAPKLRAAWRLPHLAAVHQWRPPARAIRQLRLDGRLNYGHQVHLQGCADRAGPAPGVAGEPACLDDIPRHIAGPLATQQGRSPLLTRRLCRGSPLKALPEAATGLTWSPSRTMCFAAQVIASWLTGEESRLIAIFLAAIAGAS